MKSSKVWLLGLLMVILLSGKVMSTDDGNNKEDKSFKKNMTEWLGHMSNDDAEDHSEDDNQKYLFQPMPKIYEPHVPAETDPKTFQTIGKLLHLRLPKISFTLWRIIFSFLDLNDTVNFVALFSTNFLNFSLINQDMQAFVTYCYHTVYRFQFPINIYGSGFGWSWDHNFTFNAMITLQTGRGNQFSSPVIERNEMMQLEYVLRTQMLCFRMPETNIIYWMKIPPFFFGKMRRMTMLGDKIDYTLLRVYQICSIKFIRLEQNELAMEQSLHYHHLDMIPGDFLNSYYHYYVEDADPAESDSSLIVCEITVRLDDTEFYLIGKSELLECRSKYVRESVKMSSNTNKETLKRKRYECFFE